MEFQAENLSFSIQRRNFLHKRRQWTSQEGALPSSAPAPSPARQGGENLQDNRFILLKCLRGRVFNEARRFDEKSASHRDTTFIEFYSINSSGADPGNYQNRSLYYALRNSLPMEKWKEGDSKTR
jgi:hypothetical protein